MKGFTKIERSFWETDEARDMTPEEKYFWMYLQTNSNVNTLGCYPFRMRKAIDETGYNKETLEKLLIRMVEVGRIIYDKNTMEVFLLHFRNSSWNKKTAAVRAINSDLKEVESAELREWLLEMLKKAEIPLKNYGTFAENAEEQQGTSENNKEHIRTFGNKWGEEEDEEEEVKENKKKKAEKTAFIPAMIDDDIYSLEFKAFWDAYPNKKNKQTAVNRWDKMKITAEKFRRIMEGLERAKRSWEWNKDGGDFIPHPASWLNAGGWENEYKPMPETTQNRPIGVSTRTDSSDILERRRQMMGGA